MGIRDWLGGKHGIDHEIQEMMNPLMAWRLQQFVAFHETRTVTGATDPADSQLLYLLGGGFNSIRGQR
jgi:hypothetical protein